MNTPFLKQLAKTLYKEHGPKIADLCLVFSNRRSGLFFNRYLAETAGQNLLAPRTLALEELMGELSGLVQADTLSLIFDLFEVYNKMSKVEESFDSFYFWGDMLLKDFNDIDVALGDAEQLFTLVSDYREIDNYFDALTDEQREVIKKYWGHTLSGKDSKHKDYFLNTWRILPDVYKQFKEKLITDGVAYEGLTFRRAAEKALNNELYLPCSQYIFAGFGVFEAAALQVVRSLLSKGKAQVFWDIDKYYVDMPVHEAGNFFRKHLKDPVLAATFPNPLPEQLTTQTPDISMISVALEVGQAKAAGDILARIPPEEYQQTAVVITADHMLFPVLHAIPDKIETINVTMGYPLRSTPLYTLIRKLSDLQARAITQEETAFFHYKEVLSLLRHPYVLHRHEDFQQIANDIEKRGSFLISQSTLADKHEWLARLFRPGGYCPRCCKLCKRYFAGSLHSHQPNRHRAGLCPQSRRRICLLFASYFAAAAPHVKRAKYLAANQHALETTGQNARTRPPAFFGRTVAGRAGNGVARNP